MRQAPLAKKITALLYPVGDIELYQWSKGKIIELFGEIQHESAHFPFTWTQYYRNISENLARCFFSFTGLHRVDQLADWKNQAILIESQSGHNRRINVDPGYVDGARLVLASTKDHAHRMYLRDGIFGEVTLSRKKKEWVFYSYTFPDFRSGLYDSFLDNVRHTWQREARQLKERIIE